MISHNDSLRTAAASNSSPSQQAVEDDVASDGRLLPRKLTHGEMNAAIEEGAATSPLYRQDVLRYDGRWWKLGVGGAGWLEVIDNPMNATYDRFAARMTPEMAEAQRAANIRLVG